MFVIFFFLPSFYIFILLSKKENLFHKDYLKTVGKQGRPGSDSYLGQTLSRLEAMKRNRRN